MIQLGEIHKNIRTTLDAKSKVVSRDFTGLQPLSALQSTYSKAVWVKVYSPVDNSEEKGGLDTVTILGGELNDGKMFSGFNDIYESKTDTLKRPIAGIKDISINYKGGLSAIREATINWTCWTFEDLEKFTPHFMAHGKGVLLEWGWPIPSVKQLDVISEEDMDSGKAYSILQNRVIEHAGNYDAMAGIISNWNWSLRDDGGFDCTTTIVSRGVNMLKSTISGHQRPSGGGSDNEDEKYANPSLPEFIKSLKESLWSMGEVDHTFGESVENKEPFDLNSYEEWKPGGEEPTQPPGVLIVSHDNFGWWSDKEGGPYISWGFFEDNILSKFIGRYSESGEDKEKISKIISSFRSIEPVLSTKPKFAFEKNNGDGTNHIHEAKFRSVVIRNHNDLLTTSAKRWILPGQFPYNIGTGYEHEGLTNNDEELMKSISGYVQDDSAYRRFSVDGTDKNKGGYLRNILLSYELIETAFSDANTLNEGMTILFDELNKDVDGFWKFELVADLNIDGNVKVVDVNKTNYTASHLLENRENQTDKKNPDSLLYTFPSWSEQSIVKSQTLSSKVPDAMAVSAMYASTAAKGTEADGANQEEQAIAEVTGGSGIDKSQQAAKMSTRLGGGKVLGSNNPYGDLNGEFFTSDEDKKTNIPSEKSFNTKDGIQFKNVSLADIIKMYEDAPKKGKTPEDEKRINELKLQKQKSDARRKEAIDKFNDAKEGNYGFNPGYSLYDQNGDLWNEPDKNILFRRTMVDKINGNITVGVSEEDRLAALKDPMIPIELEIEVDGVGGILPGNAFHVDYIPDRYKKYCVFQAINVDNSVNSGGWTTTIKGQIRVAMDKIIKDKIIKDKELRAKELEDKMKRSQFGRKLEDGPLTEEETKIMMDELDGFVGMTG
ncbi:hypothetical protein H8D04_00780 [bacterium]|nr:hypothetical protein [bacterium]